MNWIGSGFITIINYASSYHSDADSTAILLEDGDDLLTEDSTIIETE